MPKPSAAFGFVLKFDANMPKWSSLLKHYNHNLFNVWVKYSILIKNMKLQTFAVYFKQVGSIIQLECHQEEFDVTEWQRKHFP
jgi:hypothetical protein